MKKTRLKNCLYGTLSALFVIFSGWSAHSESVGVQETYKKATEPFSDEKIDLVLPFPDNAVMAVVKYQGGDFWTETRKDKMERFKCTQCHNNRKVTIARSAEMAHGGIVLDHGGEERPLSCYTCHKENERDFLITETGLKVDMDHSYQMCGQCHFRQKKDWVGGAHGKRISHWAGKRIVKSCASCHDPHAPLFKKRWPKIYSPPIGQ